MGPLVKWEFLLFISRGTFSPFLFRFVSGEHLFIALDRFRQEVEGTCTLTCNLFLELFNFELEVFI